MTADYNPEGIGMDAHGNLTYPTTARATGLMLELEGLWFDEGCSINLRFEDNDCEQWCLMLTWASDSGNPHGADWAEYTWQFYGSTPEESLTDAIEWCRGLLPFEACHACDGRGWYFMSTRDAEAGIQTQCDECDGSGLARAAVAEKERSENG